MWGTRKTETVSEHGRGGNTVEDIRLVTAPEFHLQVVARQALKQRVEDACLLCSCSVSPKMQKVKYLCPASQSTSQGDLL